MEILSWLQFSQNGNLLHTWPLEWLLEINPVVDKNGDLWAQQENDAMTWMAKIRLLKNTALLRIIKEILQKPIYQ
jgi:hypothetical protein